MKLVLSCIIVFSLFYNCTYYQKNGIRGGYSLNNLSKDRVKINMKLNGYTNRSYLAPSLLYRAAEITRKSKYLYFIIYNTSYNETYSYYKNPDRIDLRKNFDGSYSGTYTPGNTIVFTKPEGSIFIYMVNDINKIDEKYHYMINDADFILKNNIGELNL